MILFYGSVVLYMLVFFLDKIKVRLVTSDYLLQLLHWIYSAFPVAHVAYLWVDILGANLKAWMDGI